MSDTSALPRSGLLWFLFSFRGRVGRAQYWRFIACIAIFGILLGAADALLSLAGRGGVLGVVFLLLSFVISQAVQAKRWHDRGRSAWWLLVQFIPVAGWLWVLVECGFLSGSREDNAYGPAPEPEDA